MSYLIARLGGTNISLVIYNVDWEALFPKAGCDMLLSLVQIALVGREEDQLCKFLLAAKLRTSLARALYMATENSTSRVAHSNLIWSLMMMNMI